MITIKFEVRETSRDYIVIRVGGEYSQHAHIKTKQGVRELLYLIEKKWLPRSEYLKESCRRLLTEDEFMELKQKKQRYYNVNKGIRK